MLLRPITPQRKRVPKKRANFGTAALSQQEKDSGFSACDSKKKIWIYVSKARDHVTDKIILEYLKKQTAKPDLDYHVQEVSVKFPQKDNKHFMIGVGPSLNDTVYNPDFWSERIAWSRFNFFLGRNFLNNRR